MASTAIQFHYFSAFPAELRDAVWEQCLPYRVVDADEPNEDWEVDDDEDLASCDLNLAGSTQSCANSGCPPLISRVCRESRNVAMKNGGWVRMGGFPRVWLDPARDVLHFNWHQLVDDFTHPYCGGLVSWVVGAQAKRVSISYYLCLAGSLYEEGPDVWIQRLLEQRRSYELCLGTVIIHVAQTGQQGQDPVSDPIVSSGLFGMFGEERVKQVDARDHSQLERFAAFNRDHGSPRDARAAGFFKTYKADNVQEHMDRLRLEWLRRRWEEAKKMGRFIEDCETVWAPHPYFPDQPYLQNAEPGSSEMPVLHPVYIIRLCTRNCT
ncbi:hypothetical protein QBC46DRAFT_462537 [Diplogelasinospora grovesii]|uniref:2EXR domain-containing protein n=1 Tax=Diplogelasinospora grovesii TaxID=303347 RepID=A0AAN6RYI9_9PEZI|nr:hypothetical protein QBC46DRAFT_462537 [Diplogelasinospora grovesii]